MGATADLEPHHAESLGRRISDVGNHPALQKPQMVRRRNFSQYKKLHSAMRNRRRKLLMCHQNFFVLYKT
jgi:hypothetical protein